MGSIGEDLFIGDIGRLCSCFIQTGHGDAHIKQLKNTGAHCSIIGDGLSADMISNQASLAIGRSG